MKNTKVHSIRDIFNPWFHHCADCAMKVRKILQFKGYWLSVAVLICGITLIAAAIILRCNIAHQTYHTIYIDTQDEPAFIVNERYLSLGLDSSVVAGGFWNFNTSDPKLRKMMEHLSPAYLRVGGNQADQIIFSTSNTTEGSTPFDEYTLYGDDWLKLISLAEASNIRVIYDLNLMLRTDKDEWNSSNAEQMITFSEDHDLQVDWELGNEPNSYPFKFNVRVDPTQIGRDYHSLRKLLNSHKLYANSSLIGPSVTRLRREEIEEFFKEFLETGVDTVNAITVHHYYFSGMNATEEEFLDLKNFDYLETCISTVRRVMDSVEAAIQKPLWLGETATAWHGGAPGLSDRFIASFLFIDKLGLSAKMGVSVVVKQSIFKGDYALLDDDYNPNPNWWVSILYKQLVDSRVIATECQGESNVRLYAHCAKTNALWNDAVVVFGVNLKDQKSKVYVKELHSDVNFFSYELSSPSLLSKSVLLNGKALSIDSDWSLPELKPRIARKEDYLEIPPLSVIFWVFSGTNVKSCEPVND